MLSTFNEYEDELVAWVLDCHHSLHSEIRQSRPVTAPTPGTCAATIGPVRACGRAPGSPLKPQPPFKCGLARPRSTPTLHRCDQQKKPRGFAARTSPLYHEGSNRPQPLCNSPSDDDEGRSFGPNTRNTPSNPGRERALSASAGRRHETVKGQKDDERDRNPFIEYEDRGLRMQMERRWLTEDSKYMQLRTDNLRYGSMRHNKAQKDRQADELFEERILFGPYSVQLRAIQEKKKGNLPAKEEPILGKKGRRKGESANVHLLKLLQKDLRKSWSGSH